MIQTQDSTEAFLSQFAQLERESFAADPSWLTRVRKAAIARFAELGFPTTRQEEWRYTNVAPIAATAFEPGEAVRTTVTPEQIAPFRFAGDDACLLVFVNGRYSASLSSAGTLPAELNVVTLADAIAADAKVLEPHLARHAKYADQAFVALNTAFMRDGALVHIPRGVVVERPIHLMYVSTATDTPAPCCVASLPNSSPTIGPLLLRESVF